MSLWRNLSDRERALIWAAVAIFGAFFAYLLIVAPLTDWRAAQYHALERAEGLYELVEEAAARSAAAAPAASDTETPVRNAVSQTASSAGVNLIFVNVQPSGAVEATASLVEPANLYAWLQAMQQTYDVRVISADIAREQTETSLVRAQLTLVRRSGA